MSNRQTQSVTPLTRKRSCTTLTEGAVRNTEMAESENHTALPGTTPTRTASTDDNQSVANLLKAILENQNKQATLIPPFTRNQLPVAYGHCHCQTHSNECQNQLQNPPSDHLNADSPAINEESSIKNLLITMLKNQTQTNPPYPWNQSPACFRQQPSMHPCQMHTSNCQYHQVQNNGYAPTSSAANTNDESSTTSLLMTLLKNQTKMAAQLDSLEQMQERIMKMIQSQTSNSALPIPTRITFKKIDSVEDCNEFEENLKNLEFAQTMIKHFDSVCGGNCDLYGDNVAYALIDHIFTRRLFTLVTWTGVSRGTESKESFLKFERIFQFFFDLIRRVDSSYSIKSLKDFFQKIISNSKRRFEHKRSRISRVKLSSGSVVVKRKKRPQPDKEAKYVRRNSNVDVEQELNISDEISDNDDDDFKDNTSMYSNECNTDEVTTNQDITCIKAEDEDY